jgi:hypothetical protein
MSLRLSRFNRCNNPAPGAKLKVKCRGNMYCVVHCCGLSFFGFFHVFEKADYFFFVGECVF